eukprot:COSAG03_NODE_4692_length_1465_cov_0.912152_3_plen_85_part_00
MTVATLGRVLPAPVARDAAASGLLIEIGADEPGWELPPAADDQPRAELRKTDITDEPTVGSRQRVRERERIPVWVQVWGVRRSD